MTHTVIKEENPEIILPLDKEYGLTSKTELAEIDHYLWKGKYFFEKKIITEGNKREYITCIFDGKGRREILLLFREKPDIKWVYIYKNAEYSSFSGKMILLIPYPLYELSPKLSCAPATNKDVAYVQVHIMASGRNGKQWMFMIC